jgi:hypothetical protein
VETPEGEMFVQYGYFNFHAKWDGGPKLSLAVNNKWLVGWTKSWFYCHVPCVCSSGGRESIYILHSWMSALDYTVEPEVECPDNNPNDAAFVQWTATIRGRDTVEEFMACKMFPLASSFSFRDLAICMTPMSKIRTPLPLFPIEAVSAGDVDHILAEVETDVERFLGSFRPREHDALMMMKHPNGGRLNRVLEQIGVAYAPRLLPDSEASQVAWDKRKVEVSKKSAAKRVKTGMSRSTPSKDGAASA